MNKFNFVKRKLLKSWDPIGINYFFSEVGENDDEYDKYIYPLLSLLVKQASEKEIFDYLWDIETQYMGLPGQKEKTKKFVHSLIKEFRSCQESV